MKIEVKHCYQNPRNNRTVECDTVGEARLELHLMSSDEPGGNSTMYIDGVAVGWRDWTEKRAAARLLGRLSAAAATPEQRTERAKLGGKAAQKKLTKKERIRRAKLRWQRWREKQKTTNQGDRK